MVRGTYVQSGAFLRVGWTGPQPAFEDAVATGVDYVGADAGSTDFGPAYLGGDRGMVPGPALKQLLDYLLRITRRHGVPLLIGSANVAGTSAGLRRFRSLVGEVAREAGLRFKAAYIDTEQDKDVVKAHIAGGRVRPLRRGTALTDAEVDAATHIVAQIGAEPYLEALGQGADVIVGGRTSDPALFATVPLREGVPPAVAWHMAKVLDHGHFNIEPTPGVSTWVTGAAGADGFEIAASAPGGRCSALRVARTLLHESPHTTRFFEPAGQLDTDRCVYLQQSDRTVRVTGSRFAPLTPTLKLEGAKLAGYRSIAVCGFRSPEVVSRLAEGLRSVEQAAEAHARLQGIAAHDYRLSFHPYGAGEVLRGRPVPAPAEVGVLAECVGVSQEVAAAVMARVSLELHVLGRAYGLAGGPAAFPFSPIDLDAGPVHRFNVWHLMEVDDPLACCRIDYERY